MTDVHNLHQAANDELIKGNDEKAIEIYTKIIELAPGDEVALSQLMDLYLERDKFMYYITRANVNIVQQKYEHAINDVKKALNLESQSIEALRKLGRLYKVTGKNLRAVDEFLKILDIDANQKDAYIELIDLYTKENSPESAIGIAKKAVANFVQDSEFKNILANLYFKSGDYKNALETVEDDFLKAKILLQDEQNDSAKEILNKLKEDKNMYKESNKEQLAAYYLLEAQYYYNKKEFDEALNYVEKYTDLSLPNALSFQMKALIYEGMGDEFKSSYNWGYCYKVRKRFDEAIVEFTHAHNAKPDDKNTLIELANLYANNGEKFASMEYWKKVYEIDKDKRAGQILGDFYYEQGDLRLAEYYGKTIEKKSQKEAAYEDEGLLEKIIKLFSKK
ncbi:TPA: hypothetical protein IAA68_00935 [Candidatus Galligastranaerophilus faecipullorum]|nr:hypothetical protein [Candidatus Galligastranaerophilus faecipullorum]